jgi:hypothetical protein
MDKKTIIKNLVCNESLEYIRFHHFTWEDFKVTTKAISSELVSLVIFDKTFEYGVLNAVINIVPSPALQISKIIQRGIRSNIDAVKSLSSECTPVANSVFKHLQFGKFSLDYDVVYISYPHFWRFDTLGENREWEPIPYIHIKE